MLFHVFYNGDLRMVNPRSQWSDDDQLTPQLTAIWLGGSNKPLNIATLALWRRIGVGPTFTRVGKSIRYPVSGLKEFVTAMTVSNDNHGGHND